jgi:hypothetical protein
MGERVYRASAKTKATKTRGQHADSAARDPRVLAIARAIGRLIAREQNAAKARGDR